MTSTPTADAVCAAHYRFSDPKSCGRCPIVAVCHSHVVPLTRAKLDAHLKRLEAAAKATKPTT